MIKLLCYLNLFSILLCLTCACSKHDIVKRYSTALSIEEVKKIAENYAEKKGYNLSLYNKPIITFDAKEQNWYVDYTTKPIGFIFKKKVLGDEFSVVIEDSTGKVVCFFQGALNFYKSIREFSCDFPNYQRRLLRSPKVISISLLLPKLPGKPTKSNRTVNYPINWPKPFIEPQSA